ncbi:MAG: hypothetical protein V4819_24395 [Verrucomicrobiota bacterium]
MSAAPSEPEKYSIDEMMDRLKAPPSENSDDGELVTRSDGSQAIRVRKRKRRSSQPHKEERHRTRRIRIVQVSAALILMFLAALAIGGAIIYANSSPFRQGLIRKIEQLSGATIDLQNFRMNPKTANSGSFSLTWPDGNVLKALSLRGFTANVAPASFLGKSMTGGEVLSSYGVLALQFPKPGQALRNSPAPTGASAIRFDRYRVQNLDVILGAPAAPLIKLAGTEASMDPENVNGRPQLSLYQGDLTIEGWPKLRMDRALIEFRGTEADIIGLRVLPEKSDIEKDDRGALEFSGPVAPYKPNQPVILTVSLDAFQLSGITGPALGRLFSGKVDSLPIDKSNYLMFLPTDKPSPAFDASFRVSPNSKIEVQGFPFLFALSQLLGEDPWFVHPTFEGEASGVIHREGGVVTLRNLKLESKGRMALRGNISIAANQTLAGSLHVGLAEAAIGSATTSRLASMFGPPTDGFRWLTLKISGPATQPTDTFKELFSTTAAVPRESPAPNETEGSSFEELTRPK